jgi:hypothetical protein
MSRTVRARIRALPYRRKAEEADREGGGRNPAEKHCAKKVGDAAISAVDAAC